MNHPITRRQFVSSAALAAGALILPGCAATRMARKSPNEKLNIGVVGTANRAAQDIAGVQGENIVAICDIDSNYLDKAQEKFPKARRYSDFRKMLEQKNIDAVVVGTPDHTHAVATVAALKSGRPVYCEKPLTHTVSEARIVAALAKKTGLPTQMGNQIHATSHYRRMVELVRSGAIGKVSEVHCWINSSWNATGRPAGEVVPANINYDLWLGPAKFRPYNHAYLPANWRRYWDFGGGTLADFCCHLTDLPFWAFDLTHPLTIEAEGPPPDAEGAPAWIEVRYEYMLTDGSPLKIVWHTGDKRPPQQLPPKWDYGVLFVGSKGMLLTDYERNVLLPEKDFENFVAPARWIPDSIGHHAEWIDACKNGGSTTCNFGYGALLTEAGLLGNVAFRTGKKIEWDATAMRAKNCPEADQYIQHHYRSGWKI